MNRCIARQMIKIAGEGIVEVVMLLFCVGVILVLPPAAIVFLGTCIRSAFGEQAAMTAAMILFAALVLFLAGNGIKELYDKAKEKCK